jgi:hypothetical protein
MICARVGNAFTRAPRFGFADADAIEGADERVTVSGDVTLNGEPLQHAFVWAEVTDGGLRRLCAFDGASPSDGRYERTLVSDRELAGCGAPGRRIRIAASTGGEVYFSSNSVPWPATGDAATLDVNFTDADAGRAIDNVTPVYGSVYDASGERRPPGTTVEAFIGDTLCGITALPESVLVFQNPDQYDVLVASPEAVPGCEREGAITFRVNGELVAQTAHNDLGDGVLVDLVAR